MASDAAALGDTRSARHTTSSSSPTYSTYTVQPGDTLGGIAERYLGDSARWHELFQLNRGRSEPGGSKLAASDFIEPGWSVHIPGSGPHYSTRASQRQRDEPTVDTPTDTTPASSSTYTVQPGDTLSSIAARELGSGARWQEIFALNEDRVQPDGGTLVSPEALRVGWTLLIPGGRPGSGETRAATNHLERSTSLPSGSQPTARSSAGSVRTIARSIVPTSQFRCFDEIISHESSWNVQARNASSGAYGLPQALPGSKMATAGPDWRTSPTTQIKWALGYMDSRYGSPCGAWSFWQDHSWY
ncbi:LysM peptidoglycan-binding domain-containing protein [Streptomyces sp. PTM05]|uniref:LysM peptidoglycan-binding domain-containing protein n=1 Tax=Streptantibioticus parmotrematis TaxID=2873249 RepID=A0ABS7QWG9_9ACTN|nr:LysM peptidoglycan-binding domain-containing protein [Streptantibioticus parmotrematis]MBY8887041.1 LysM peptidoglycan-binding domain-containing protein [Streptantibioticus parmotrematis]